MRSPILVIGFCDPYPRFEVFGDKTELHVHTVVAPTLLSAEGELAARTYVEKQLPHPFRNLMWPSNFLGGMRIDRTTPSDLDWQLDVTAFLRRSAVSS